MNIKTLLTLGTLSLGSIQAYGFAIATPGTEGLKVIVAGGNPVIATYEGNSAGYSNDLYLERDAFGNPGIDGITANDLFIFNNHGNTPGDTFNLGSFTSGLELIFRLHVNNTGDNFYTGPGSRNSDGLAHARVDGSWAPGKTLVSFEDLRGLPEGVNGYNDLSFSFTNTRDSNHVPDSGSSLLFLSLGLTGMAAAARRINRKA